MENSINKVDVIKEYTVVKNILPKSHHRSNVVVYQDTLISMLVPDFLDVIIYIHISLSDKI